MATVTTDQAKKVMKRCQIGTRNYDEANNLHAECYGTIGALMQERDNLRLLLAEAADYIECWGAYASEYFQQKHDLQGCVAKYRNAMTPNT